MDTKTVISSRVEDIEFGYWNEEEDEWVELVTDEQLLDASKALGVKVEFLKALKSSFDMLREYIHDDLKDIWERLDAIEEK